MKGEEVADLAAVAAEDTVGGQGGGDDARRTPPLLATPGEAWLAWEGRRQWGGGTMARGGGSDGSGGR